MMFKSGQMIRFTYHHKKIDGESGDKFKEILVLHPSWKFRVHGIDLKRLTPAERKVLELVLDPDEKDTVSRIPLVNNIKKRMDPMKEIQNPMTFYVKFVKPFLNGKDAYRMYIPANMLSVTVLKDFSIATGTKKNPNPLFGPKPEPVVSQQPEKPSAMSPIDIMAQNAKNRGLK